jgi:hypothetical protein
LNSTTLRKQYVNHNVVETNLEEEKSRIDEQKDIIFESTDEERVLREEIRFLRHLIDMAQNAEK